MREQAESGEEMEECKPRCQRINKPGLPLIIPHKPTQYCPDYCTSDRENPCKWAHGGSERTRRKRRVERERLQNTSRMKGCISARSRQGSTNVHARYPATSALFLLAAKRGFLAHNVAKPGPERDRMALVTFERLIDVMWALQLLGIQEEPFRKDFINKFHQIQKFRVDFMVRRALNFMFFKRYNSFYQLK